ncbi:hypothetical protein FB567DRAFT_511835 [Paraphoma chrysanthemicola]|uniref:Glomerulosclerosis protein Mpv17 n=1 Tax=Paraphoma chrysanthemicola TaxID=798071 RepID=A0A8K0W4B5_9PLEO|nr:hypothetical protein FB567DRAFT_511835 [Paraphoma chrysanthemicola]
MILQTCALGRVGLRRIPPFPSRSRISGNTTKFEHVHMRTSLQRISRRYNALKPPVAQKAPETASTIPGPSWLWLEPIYEPFRAYGRVQQRKPYMTQFISSLVIYFVGDLVAQSIAEPVPKEASLEEGAEMGWVQEWSDNRDWHRTGRSLMIGGLSSIPAYKWFLWLGNNFNYGSKILSLTTKVVVNQAFFTPIFNSYFFGMQSLLSGASIPEIIERIKNTVPTSWINSCKVWPAITAFSFTYIPIQYRSIFGGVIAIGWQTYLSLLNQRAAAEEEAEHAVERGTVAEVRDVRIEQRGEEREGRREKCVA